MTTVKVSPKYQVVIPREVREAMGIRPGEKLHVFQYDDRIELVPARSMRKMRGFMRGISTVVERDGDRV